MTLRPFTDAAAERGAAPHFVYEFYDRDARLLYVGCTSSIGQRLSSHRSERPWWPEVVRVEATLYPDQRAGLDAERDLIERSQPIHNSVYTEGHDAGGWWSRKAKMAAAHDAGVPCRDKTCHEGCADLAHSLGFQCARSYTGCSECVGLVPDNLLDRPQEVDCYRELVRRHGPAHATRLTWATNNVLEALFADHHDIDIDELERDYVAALAGPLTRRRSA
jgi:hypothetical protein